MTIYVTRHGETELNIQGITCGRQQCDLNAAGLRQAQSLARKVANLPIDLIVCSPLLRATHTANLAAQAIGCEVITDERLIELNFGEYDGKPYFTEEFEEARRQFAAPLPGGESLFQLVQRTYNVMDDLLETYRDKTLLIVSHGGTCRIIHSYFTPMTNEQFYRFYMENCQLLTYTVE